MTAAQVIIRREFPDIGGLKCVSLSPVADYPKATSNKFIEILHSSCHWVVVAKGFFGSNVLTVYYCLKFTENCRQQVLADMSSLVRVDVSSMAYTIAGCQRQTSESNDYGVFAIAFAVSLAFGEDSCKRL